MKKKVLAILLLVVMTFSVTQVMASEKKITITNPYKNVDWSTFKQYRSNLHTHTTKSDGGNTPDKMIDTYHNKGYDILALTDHDSMSGDKTSWPWTDFGRDPEELGMVAVEGTEVSRTHHTLSLFSDYGGGSDSEDEAISEIGKHGGLAVFAHPGKYTKSIEWYLDFYEKYPHLVGVEILNQGNRYKNDRNKWDELLTRTMPQRNIWGFGDDDSHAAHITGRDWEVYVLDELSLSSVKEATREGQFFVSSCFTIEGPKGDVPYISSIDVNEEKGEITITGDKYHQIQWISQGNVVATGEKINCMTTPGIDKYVRAVLTGVGGETYTQPFGITFSEFDDKDALNYSKESLTFERLSNEEPDKVTSNISLPAEWLNKTGVTWTSSNKDIISNDGIVTRPNEDTIVVLTATITKNGISTKKHFNIKVLKMPTANGISVWANQHTGKVVAEGGYEFAGDDRVTLTVQDSDNNYVYIMQKNREDDNTFKFEFYLDNFEAKDYTLKIGAKDNNVAQYNISMNKDSNNIAVSMLSITDESDEQVTTVNENQMISINATLEKKVIDDINNATMIAVVYDVQNNIIGVYNTDSKLYSLTEDISLEITVPKISEKGSYVKIYMWNSFCNLKPIAKAKILNLN